MSYNRDNFVRIKKEYSEKRASAGILAEEKKKEIYKKHPDIEIIDIELAKTLSKVVDEICLGSDKIDSRIAQVRKENEALQEKRALLLEKYGYPKDYTDIKYECNECKDTGYSGCRMCACMKRALVKAGIESSGIGNLLKNQNFDNFSLDYYPDESKARMKNTLDFCKEYAENFTGANDNNLLFFGGTGLGKTHLSTSIAAVVIERGFDVVYDSSSEIFREYEKERFSNDINADTYKYENCELLIIDDLGTELINQFTVSILYNIINSRIISGRATVINTNLSSEELRKKYTDRVVSRLFGEYTVFPFIGKDIRLQKLGKK